MTFCFHFSNHLQISIADEESFHCINDFFFLCVCVEKVTTMKLEGNFLLD